MSLNGKKTYGVNRPDYLLCSRSRFQAVLHTVFWQGLIVPKKRSPPDFLIPLSFSILPA